MRYAVGTGTIDPGVEPMLDELHTHCVEFRQWWETHDVVDQEVATRTFHHPTHGLRQAAGHGDSSRRVLHGRLPVTAVLSRMARHCNHPDPLSTRRESAEWRCS